ncbi:hypothetical protein Bca101_081076 [Brassica carinata]
MIWLPIAKSHSITNFMGKELNDVLEKKTKKEITAIVLAIARAVTPAIEKTMSSAIIECFQSGGGGKAVNQLGCSPRISKNCVSFL